MATGDKLVFSDKKGNRLFITKDSTWYGYNKENKQIDTNGIIILVERAGFVIDRIEKNNGRTRLILEDEAVEKDLM